MKKLISILALGAIVGLFVAGCSQPESNAGGETGTATSGTTGASGTTGSTTTGTTGTENKETGGATGTTGK